MLKIIPEGFLLLASAMPAFAEAPIGDSTFQPQEVYQPEQQEAPEIPTCNNGEVLSFMNGQMICTDFVRFSERAVSAGQADTAGWADRAATADSLQGLGPDDLSGDVIAGWVRSGFKRDNSLTPIEKCRSSFGSDVKRTLMIAYTYFDPYKYHYHWLCIK